MAFGRGREPHVCMHENDKSIFSRVFLRTAMNGSCKRYSEYELIAIERKSGPFTFGENILPKIQTKCTVSVSVYKLFYARAHGMRSDFFFFFRNKQNVDHMTIWPAITNLLLLRAYTASR